MAAFVAEALLLAALLLQQIGKVDTCTQGAPDGYATGALLSALLLLAVSILMVRSWRHSPRIPVSKLTIAGWTVLAATSVLIFILHRGVWVEAWFGTGHVCGPDYASSLEGNEAVHVAISLVYGAWPLAISIIAVLALNGMLRRRIRPEEAIKNR